MSDRTRERIVELVQQMRRRTVENGCTPGEAAKFAAKVAEWIERYQIEDAETRVKESDSDTGFTAEDVECVENKLRTGKRVFNPGMTQVVNALAQGMSCKIILINYGEAIYGVIGDQCDANYVCQVALTLVPALQQMAKLEGLEYGYEKAGLIRWSNQYLVGAAEEILKRLQAERSDRSAAKKAAAGPGTSLSVITGESIATIKREVVAEAFKQLYPTTRNAARSRCEYNRTAHNAGREAGKRVGLHVGIRDQG